MTNIGTIDNLQNRNLVDQENLQERKLYLYKITNHNDKGFIKEQSLSIIHLEPVGTINAIRAEERQTIIQEIRQNNSKGNTALLVPRTSGMQYTTEEYFETDGVLMASFDFITITNGKVNKELFFVDNIERQLIQPRVIHGKKGAYNPTDFSLTNVKDITNNYNALGFLYTWEKEIENPNKIDLSMNNYTLLSKIMAKGEVAGKKHQDIDLEVNAAESSKLSLLTMTPTSTNYKLSMFSHWLDANKTLPFIKAKNFIAPKTLKDLFLATDVDFADWSATEIGEAYKVVVGMMRLTNAYATNFARYKDDTGKIDRNKGYEIAEINLYDLADKNPVNAIDGIMENFKSKYPKLVETPGMKILFEVITMLSTMINSTYAIGRGNNDFNKVYLPWYFVCQTDITNLASDATDVEVVLKSEYFDLENATNPLTIKDEYRDISSYVVHDLNGWVSQPELPNQLAPINKFARPGDVDTKSDNDLKYLFYVPFEQENILENLYGSLVNTSPIGWHDEGKTRTYSGTVDTSSSSGHPSNPTLPTLEEAKKAIVIPANARIKSVANLQQVGGITESSSQSISSSGSSTSYIPGQGMVTTPDYHVTTTYTKTLSYTIEYELEIYSSIATIAHKGTIYDKLNWRSVCNSLTNGHSSYKLTLEPNHKFDLNIDKINEINIQAIWFDYISIKITNGTQTLEFTDIELPSIDDESLSNFSILV